MSNVNVDVMDVMDATAFSQYTEVCSKFSTFSACSFTLSYFVLHHRG